MVEVAVALEQAETARVVVGEHVEAQVFGIAQRPPDPFAAAGPHRQAVGVVDLRAPVPVHAAVVLADLVHAGARAQAEALDGLARVQRAVDVHQQHLARGDGEAVGAGDAGRVEQAVHHHRVGLRRRAFQPVGDEVGEFLGVAGAGVDRQAARGLAVLALDADRAEIAGAQEGGEIALGVLAGVEAETGEAQVGRQGLAVQAAAPAVEHARVVGDLAGLAVGQFVHAHRRFEEQAQVEELGEELAVAAAPQGVVAVEADRLVLVPVHRRDRRRQGAGARRVGAPGERAGLALERGEVEGLGRAELARGGTGQGQRGQRQAEGGQRGGRGFEELASDHGGGDVRRWGLSMLANRGGAVVRGLSRPARWWEARPHPPCGRLLPLAR